MKLVATLATLLLLSQSASAFTLAANNLQGWQTKKILIYTNSNNCFIFESQLLQAIEEAADLWDSSTARRHSWPIRFSISELIV